MKHLPSFLPSFLPCALTVMALGAASAGEGWAQIGSYSRLGWQQRTQATPFSARRGHRMVYRPGPGGSQGHVYLWGGFDTAVRNDMWRTSDGGATWSAVSQGATVPSARWRHGMAYDRLRDRIVVFAGNGPGVPDVWHFDPVAQAWQQGPNLPGAAGTWEKPLAVYMDNIQMTAVYGGYPSGINDDDTYGYAIDASNAGSWTTLSTVGPTGVSSPGRSRHATAHGYDATRGRLVLAGGVECSGCSILDEVWEFDGSAWTESAQAPVPPARHDAAAAFDRDRSRLTLFGGAAIVGAGNGEMGTWEFPGTAPWELEGAPCGTICTASATELEARSEHAMAYDEYREKVVLAGGSGSCSIGLRADAWEYGLYPRTSTPSVVTGLGTKYLDNYPELRSFAWSCDDSTVPPTCCPSSTWSSPCPSPDCVPYTDLRAYPNYRNGLNVAAGDLGTRSPTTGVLHGPVIVTGPGPGPTFGPHVRGWRHRASGGAGYLASNIPSINFYAYNTLNFGVNVGTGDVFDDPATGDFEEILTGPGPSAVFGPQVRSWTWHWTGSGGQIQMKHNFFAFGCINNCHGIHVASTDMGNPLGGAYDEILAGDGPDPTPAGKGEIRIFRTDGALGQTDITPATPPEPFPGDDYGIRVGGGDLDGNGKGDILAARGDLPSPVTMRVAAYMTTTAFTVGTKRELQTHAPWTAPYGNTVAAGPLVDTASPEIGLSGNLGELPGAGPQVMGRVDGFYYRSSTSQLAVVDTLRFEAYGVFDGVTVGAPRTPFVLGVDDDGGGALTAAGGDASSGGEVATLERLASLRGLVEVSPDSTASCESCPDPRPGEWSVWGSDARKREVLAALDALTSSLPRLTAAEIGERVDAILALVEDPREGLTNETARTDWRMQLQAIAGR